MNACNACGWNLDYASDVENEPIHWSQAMRNIIEGRVISQALGIGGGEIDLLGRGLGIAWSDRVKFKSIGDRFARSVKSSEKIHSQAEQLFSPDLVVAGGLHPSKRSCDCC